MSKFTSVKSDKISNLISEQIKSAILNGIFVTGDKLPSERELAERFHASRISIREALKGLEASGFLQIKHGAGVFVVEIDSKSMSDSLFSILRIQGTSMNELTEARAILEPIVAKLATEKITDAEIAALEENIAETKKLIRSNPSLASAKNIEFHSMIAETTRNTVITITMQTLFRVVTQMTLEISNDVSKRVIVTSDAIKFHEDIVRGMKDRDAERVYRLMLKHISQIQSGFNMLKSDKLA